MAFTVDKEDSGMLFKNDRKEKETHPDYQGQVNIGGTQLRIAAWIKPGKKGKYMSLSFSPVRTEGERPVGTEAPQEFDDDIPF